MIDPLDLRASDEAAVIDSNTCWSYRALAQRVASIAARWLNAGLEPARGDRVFITPSTSIDGVAAVLAMLSLRATAVLGHPRWTDVERSRAIAASQPRIVVADDRIERVRPPRQRADRRPPAVVVFTSGSTGTPKGASLSRTALIAAARAHASALPFLPGDRWLLAMPLAHVGGLSIVLRSVYAATTVVIGPARFDPLLAHRTLVEQRITLLSVVPTMLERLVESGEPPRSLRAVLVGGAACPVPLLAAARAKGWPALPTYGLTECCAQVCTQRLESPRPSGVGPALPEVEVRIATSGEILVRGPTCMDGWLDQPPSTSPIRDGWLHTGDLGLLDREQHLQVLGRLDDRIVCGGENVDPLEVEEALASHPAVRAVCVAGVPDPSWGHAVAALIVPLDPAAPPSAEALRAHLADRLARFKHPRIVQTVEALPLHPTGKLDRRRAADLLARIC